MMFAKWISRLFSRKRKHPHASADWLLVPYAFKTDWITKDLEGRIEELKRFSKVNRSSNSENCNAK